jgi:hypothetical protein
MAARRGVVIDIDKVKLFVGAPCYGGQLYYHTARGLVELTNASHQLGFGLEILWTANESLVTRARNRLVSNFMGGDFTHMIFIDSDIGFNARDIMVMLLADLDVTVGAYPKKEIVWSHLEKAVRAGVKTADLPFYASNQVANFHPKVVEGGPMKIATLGPARFVEVQDGGTGFMLIKRSVIEKMQAAHPELQYEPDNMEQYGCKPYALFDCFIEEGTRRYLSEDWGFCRRWQALGGTIWAYLGAKLSHTGTFTFEGDAEKALGLEEDKYEDLPVQMVDPS